MDLAVASGPPASEIFYPLPDLVVSTGVPGSPLIQLNLVLALNSPDDAAVVRRRLPWVLDGLTVLLRELRPDDLKGQAGLQRLRTRLLASVSETVRPIPVPDLLFNGITIQAPRPSASDLSH